MQGGDNARRIDQAGGVMSENDPTRMRNQPALTTSSGRIWIVVGAITTVLIAGVMVALWLRLDSTLALVIAILSVVLFALMVVVRFSVHPLRQRLVILAVIFAVEVGAGLIGAFVIAFGQGPTG